MKDKKKVLKHLKDDIKTFKHEANDDRKLIETLDKKKHEKKESKAHEKAEDRKKAPKKKLSKAKKKIKKVMEEGMSGKLHSGSKKGPIVKKRSQMIAIALSEAGKSKKK